MNMFSVKYLCCKISFIPYPSSVSLKPPPQDKPAGDVPPPAPVQDGMQDRPYHDTGEQPAIPHQSPSPDPQSQHDGMDTRGALAPRECSGCRTVGARDMRAPTIRRRRAGAIHDRLAAQDTHRVPGALCRVLGIWQLLHTPHLLSTQSSVLSTGMACYTFPRLPTPV